MPHQHALSFPKVQKPEKSKSIFKEILGKEQQELKVSKHAEKRLQERNINLNEKQWKDIEQKMQEAKQKGITDSLVVMNEAALLVSTKNNTVITRMKQRAGFLRI